jgi:hypothetical protein
MFFQPDAQAIARVGVSVQAILYKKTVLIASAILQEV